MPPQLQSQIDQRPVKVYLRDLNLRESIPHRTIHLYPPTYEVKIGRGSQAEQHLHPKESNAWFSSRVMSRDHAILRLDPVTEIITLEDTSSMHGTYVKGTILERDTKLSIRQNEEIQLGAEIVRGEQIYKPLHLSVRVDWNTRSEESYALSPELLTTLDYSPPSTPLRNQLDSRYPAKNTFTIDYSEDEDDDDIQVISESIGDKRLEPHPRTFSVPDSDESEHSEGEELDDSAPSSPADNPDLQTDDNLKLNESVNKPMGFVISSTSSKPGSTPHNAVNVDAEDAENNLMDNANLDAAEALSTYSDDEPYSRGQQEQRNVNLAALFYDDDDDLDEEEPESVSKGANEANLGGPASNLRANSPSDCALLRAPWNAQENLPGIHDIVEMLPPQSFTFPPAFSTALPVTPFQPFNFYNSANWNGNDTNSSFANPYEQGLVGAAQDQLQHAVPIPVPSVTAPSPDHAAFKSSSNLANIKPSKVSINDILDNTEESTIVSNGRKRKASHISSGTHVEEHTAIKAPSEPDLSIRYDDNINDEDSDMGDVCRRPVFGGYELESERLQKKAKIEHNHQGSNVLKYLAATIAGATLGAVGTVFGLAALPPDYFTN